MKVTSEIEVEPFITIECPYCYNVRDWTISDRLTAYDNKILVYCEDCHNSIIIEMSIPKRNVDRLGLDSVNLRVDDFE